MLPIHRPPRQFSQWRGSIHNGKALWGTSGCLLAVQCTGTYLASLFDDPLPYEVTNTDLLYGRSIYSYLSLFFSVQVDSVFALLLAIYNTFLLTFLLGCPEIWKINLTRKKILTYLVPLIAIICMRMLLGYLFGRGTGWAYPSLFFNDSIHETTYGFSVIILYIIAGRVFGVIPTDSNGHFMTFRLTLLLWSPNMLRGPVFFWSFSTVAIAGIQGIIFLLVEGRGPSLGGSQKYNDQRLSRLDRLVSMVRYFLLLGVLFALISYMHSTIYRSKHEAHARSTKGLPEPILTQFLILSYPRRVNSTILSSTLRSYTSSTSLNGRFTAHVYTTSPLEFHPAFVEARDNFKRYPALSFFQDSSPTQLQLGRPLTKGYLPGKQTFDLYAALDWMEQNTEGNNTRYIGIMEDDFEWCSDGWDELMANIYEVHLREQSLPNQATLCGIFVATGGSGLLVRPSVLPLLRNALKEYAFKLNPDVIIQDCLAGDLPICSSCTLAASRRLLFRHTGATESTYKNRTYPVDRWQCGWRQPFNGRLGVWVP